MDNNKQMESVKSVIQQPYKTQQFQAFLELVRTGKKLEYWEQIAEALGVHKNTITAWKETEEGKTAIAEGIITALENMEKSGKRDWKMWAAKASMLGVNINKTSETNVSVGVQINQEKEVSDEQLVRRIVGIVERIKQSGEGEAERGDQPGGEPANTEGHEAGGE